MIKAKWACTTCEHESKFAMHGSFKEALEVCPKKCANCGKLKPWNSTEGFAMTAVEVKSDTKD